MKFCLLTFSLTSLLLLLLGCASSQQQQQYNDDYDVDSYGEGEGQNQNGSNESYDDNQNAQGYGGDNYGEEAAVANGNYGSEANGIGDFDAGEAVPFTEEEYKAPTNYAEVPVEANGTSQAASQNLDAASIDQPPVALSLPKAFVKGSESDIQSPLEVMEAIAPERPSLDLSPLQPYLWWVGFDYRPDDAVVRVEIVTKENPKYTITLQKNMSFQYELVVRLYQTRIRKKVRRKIDTSEFASPIALIRMQDNLEADAAEVIITLRDQINPRVFTKRGNLLLTFPISPRYFGVEGIDATPVEQAQVISNLPVVASILPGSEPPVNPNMPDEYDPSIVAFGKDVDVGAGEEFSPNALGAPVEGSAYEGVAVEQPYEQTGYPSTNYAENQSPNSLGAGQGANYDNGVNQAQTNQGNEYGNQQYDNQQYDNQQYDNQQYDNQQYDNQQYDENLDTDLNDFNEGDNQNDFDVFFEDGMFTKDLAELVPDYSFTIKAVAQYNYDLDTNADYDNGPADADSGASPDSLEGAYGQTLENNGGQGGQEYGDSLGLNNPGSNYANGGNAAGNPNNLGLAPNNLNQDVSAAAGTGAGSVENISAAASSAEYPANEVPIADDLGNTGGDSNIYAPIDEYPANSVSTGVDGSIDLTGTEVEGVDNIDDQGQPNQQLKPVSIDFRGARLKDVINVLAAENGTNFTFPDDVGDKVVNLKLEGVHWTDALRAVLETYGLGYVELPGGVVRIDTLARLTAQNEGVAQARTRSARLIDTKILVMRLSYAKAEDIQKTIDDMLDKELDPRSKVTADPRTNSIMVEAIPQVLAKAKAIVERVDLQTPQVRIETRIVEVIRKTRNFLGVDWGGPYRHDPARGQGFSSLPFPNSINSTYAIDTGSVTSPDRQGGRFNVHFGSINDSFELDMSLRLEEAKGNNKILQNSSVIVLDNQEANILAGRQDLIVGRNADGSTSVIEINYNLNLTVTPKIAADTSIQMKIKLESHQPDSSVASTANAGRVGSNLETSLRRNNGETAVIGGVYTSNEEDSEKGIPFLMDIPIIGALFKSSTVSATKRELVVLLTPSIVATKDPNDIGLNSSTGGGAPVALAPEQDGGYEYQGGQGQYQYQQQGQGGQGSQAGYEYQQGQGGQGQYQQGQGQYQQGQGNQGEYQQQDQGEQGNYQNQQGQGGNYEY